LASSGRWVVNNDEPNFSPDTELFQVEDRAADTLRSESTIDQATFIVEAPDDGDVLTADAFREFATACSSGCRSRNHHRKFLNLG